MTARERRSDRAKRRAAGQLLRCGAEVRQHRILAGLSLETVGAASGASRSAVARLELGQLTDISLARLTAIANVVGLDPSLRLYPTGAPLRDAGHLALLERLRAQLHPTLGWRTEVPLPGNGELRAWDAVISKAREWRPVEAETRLSDSQALERRTNLKMRDGGATHVILLVADTRMNRAAIRAAADAWRAAFPLGTRAALGALRGGELPPASALIVL